MAGLLKRNKKKDNERERTPVTYDYSFNDSMESITADLPGQDEPDESVPTPYPQDNPSDTPENALKKFRAEHGYTDDTDTAAGDDAQDETDQGDEEDDGEEADNGRKKRRRHGRRRRRSRMVYEEPTQQELDEEAEIEKQERRRRREAKAGRNSAARQRIRKIASVLITITLILFIAAIGIVNFTNIEVLKLPASVVSRVITPVQSVFSGLTNGISGYLRKLKLRSTLETAYE